MPNKHRYTFNKLVRNKTKERLLARGGILNANILTDEQFKRALIDKAHEEIDEVATAKDKAALMSELADVLEVLHAIAAAHQISIEDVEKKRQSANTERGGFDERIFANYADVEDGSLAHQYLENNNSRYEKIESD
jgi:predicted house-cleaning noncanonical NTP pyrophosphatase (MazG superfamily)